MTGTPPAVQPFARRQARLAVVQALLRLQPDASERDLAVAMRVPVSWVRVVFRQAQHENAWDEVVRGLLTDAVCRHARREQDSA